MQKILKKNDPTAKLLQEPFEVITVSWDTLHLSPLCWLLLCLIPVISDNRLLEGCSLFHLNLDKHPN